MTTRAGSGTAIIPEHESALIPIFQEKPGTIGLTLDKDGQPLGAWFLSGYSDTPDFPGCPEEEGWAYTTRAQESSISRLMNEELENPLVVLHGEEAKPWEGNELPIFELASNGLVDLSLEADGSKRSGEQIARILATADPGRFFAIDNGNDGVELLGRARSGEWVSNSCGPDLTYTGPWPHVDPEQIEYAVHERGFDTPFVESGFPTEADPAYIPGMLENVERVHSLGVFPGRGAQ